MLIDYQIVKNQLLNLHSYAACVNLKNMQFIKCV